MPVLEGESPLGELLEQAGWGPRHLVAGANAPLPGSAGWAAVADCQLRQVFPGQERQLRQVRRWLAGVLPAAPLLDDLASIATELAANAIEHTSSGHDGAFAVELSFIGPVIRLAVTDGGGPGEPRLVEDPDAEHGRGLLLVRGLSAQMGIDGGPDGRTVWAEIKGEES